MPGAIVEVENLASKQGTHYFKQKLRREVDERNEIVLVHRIFISEHAG